MSSLRTTPRSLTEEEIENMVSGITDMTYAVKTATQLALSEIKNTLRNQLRSIELVPAAIPEMKRIIRNQFYRSVIEPSTPVGLLVADALSQPITQMTLNTFHASGSSKNVSSGIDALRELFNVSETRKNYNMTINFNTCNLSYDDVFDVRTKMVEVTMQSLIRSFVEVPGSTEKPEWTNGYLRLTNQRLPDHKWSLRIFLDVNRMLAYKISISKIMQMIRDKSPPQIIVVPSPMAVGILDIYPNENEIDDELGENSSLMFLSVTVLPMLQDLLISGIKGIDGIFPMSVPVLSIVSEEIHVDGNEYYLAFNLSKMRKTGIGLAEVENLLSLAGIQVLPSDNVEEGVYVVMPEEAVGEKGYEPPLKYVNALLKKEENAMDAEERQVIERALKNNENLSPEELLKIQSQAKGYIAKASKFYQSSKCWNVETNGKNFLEIIKLPEVDPYHTYSNDFYETSELLGIEATRTLLMMELKNVLVQEDYINSRHISLLVDVMTNLGSLTAISFYGAQRFGQGALSLATNQQSMKVFTQAAAFGKKEKVDSVSASIMVGKQANMGEGYFEVLPSKSNVPPPQPNPVQFGQTVNNKFNEVILNSEESVEQEPKDNQAYMMDVMTNNIVNPIYGRQIEKRPQNLVPLVSVSVPKIISPTLVEVAKSVQDMPIIGEETLENKTIQNPEKQKELTKVAVKPNTTVVDRIEIDLPEEGTPVKTTKQAPKPSVRFASELAPEQAPQQPTLALPKRREREERVVQERRQEVTGAVTAPSLAPSSLAPSLPVLPKKKTASDIASRMNRLGLLRDKSERETPKKEALSTINVEENIDKLSNL
jgi:hypothetical protein